MCRIVSTHVNMNIICSFRYGMNRAVNRCGIACFLCFYVDLNILFFCLFFGENVHLFVLVLVKYTKCGIKAAVSHVEFCQ